MKYRIVRNGLGRYAVQFKRWWGWQFWKEDDGDGDYYRLEFESETEAHQTVARSVTTKQNYKERSKKAKTWEVVG